MMIKIEKGISIPIINGMKYPFYQMAVGDSFFVPRKLNKKHPSKELVARAAYEFSRRNKRQFVSRPATKDGVKGVRIWRTE